MNQLERRFIIKNKNGTSSEFLFNDNKIFEHVIGENSQNEVINDVCNDFYVLLDEQDIVHILCQNLNGDIIYMKYANLKWEKQIILVSKATETYDKHFFILSSNSQIHFFFIIKNKENWLLIHQIKFNDKVSEPIVIDSINLSSRPFSICADKKNTIWCFYNKINLGFTQLGYQKYNQELKRWNNFVFLTSSNANNSTPSIIVDKSNNIHIVYLRQKSQTISIIYQRQLSDKTIYQKWAKEVIIENANSSCSLPILLMFDENVWVMWRFNDDIWMSFLTEDKDWSKPLRYDFTYFDRLYDIIYFSNIEYEYSRIVGKNFIGSIGEKVYLIPINELLDQFKDYIEESAASSERIEDLGNINIYLENLKSFITKIAQKAAQIEKQKNEFQKEIDLLKKTNLKLREESINIRHTLDFYDEENKKLLSQLEELNKKIHNFNELLSNKDTEISENSQKLSDLLDKNNSLNLEIKYLKSELEIEKNLPFFKRLLKFNKNK